jgi:hypothetical protein
MPKKITPEQKARALRMVAEHQQDYSSVTAVWRLSRSSWNLRWRSPA